MKGGSMGMKEGSMAMEGVHGHEGGSMGMKGGAMGMKGAVHGHEHGEKGTVLHVANLHCLSGKGKQWCVPRQPAPTTILRTPEPQAAPHT